MRRWLPAIILAFVLLLIWVIGDLQRAEISTRAWLSMAAAIVIGITWIGPPALRALTDRRRRGGALDAASKAGRRLIEHQWREAMAALEARNLTAATLAQPWYLALGPTGVGKTSLIQDGGVGFASLSGGRPGGSDPKPTATFEWWRNEDALVIDTAGRFVSEPKAMPEWLTLLRLIRSARRQQPLNGVIACVGIGDLLKKGEAAIAAEAQALRDRLDELTAELGVVLPVYVVFTKCDQLGGFKNFFADINREDKDQVWGYTLPWAPGRPFDAAVTCPDEARRLATALQCRRLAALGRCADDDAQRKLFQFPIQFNAAQKWTQDFLATLLKPNHLRESSAARGVYFTSCFHPPPGSPHPTTPSGGNSTRAPLASKLPVAIDASVFITGSGLTSTAAVNTRADARIGFFLRNLMARVVIGDRALARPTRRAQAAAKHLRFACLVVVPLLGAMTIVAIVASAVRSMALIEGTRNPAHEVITVERANPNDAPQNLAALDKLGEQLGRLVRGDHHRLGPVVDGVGTLYFRRLRLVLLDACAEQVRADLQRLETGAEGGDGAHNRLFELYRAYQMLGGKVASSAPVLERALYEQRRWFRAVDVGGKPTDFQTEVLAKRQLPLLADLLGAHWNLPCDEQLIERVNRLLGETIWIRQGYDDAMRSVQGQFPTMRATALISGADSAVLTAGHEFPQAFTQAGWDDAVESALGEKSEALARTLADLGIRKGRDEINRRLAELFAADHDRHWLSLIASSRAAGLHDFRDVPDHILRLTSADSPYRSFIKAAWKGLSLRTSGAQLFAFGESTDWVDPCLQAVAELRKDAQKFLAATEAGRRATDPKHLKELAERFNAASARIGDAIGGIQPAEKRAAVHQGLNSVLHSLFAPLDRELGLEQQAVWVDRVHRPFTAQHAGSFPFDSQAVREVALGDFAKMFNPVSGWVWSSIRPIEDLRAVQVIGRPALTLSTAYEAALKRAKDIRDLFFAGNSETVHAPFAVVLMQREGVEDLNLSFGAQSLGLWDRPDARFQTALKQNDAPSAKVSIRVVTDQWKTREYAKQDWALLRLLRDGDAKVQANGSYLFTWPFEGKAAGSNVEFKACLMLEPGGLDRAIVGDLFSGFVVPDRIVDAATTRDEPR
ncbi:MAG: hypothetical protein H0W72_00230 [Planctomycetes bacterium]|nr:hypothetical protein [Planctomycetota bacterium]